MDLMFDVVLETEGLFSDLDFRVLLRERGSYLGLSNSVGTDRYYCGNCRHVMMLKCLSKVCENDRYYCGNCRYVMVCALMNNALLQRWEYDTDIVPHVDTDFWPY